MTQEQVQQSPDDDTVEVKCPKCKANNIVDTKADYVVCWRCGREV